MTTYSTKISDIQRSWVVVDATDEILGRLAARVAILLRGKHKPMFVPHLDVGDHVIVVNAGKIRVTGQKLADKAYYRHSGYPGGLKKTTLAQLISTRPEDALSTAVRGMLPRNKLGDAMFKKLKVYAGPSHPHQAQKPEEKWEKIGG
jgi:large subunit ribosomal protein L13